MSCISLAGCSSGKFKAVKLCQSSSTSGPVLTLNPMRLKMSTISSLMALIGCIDPRSWGLPVRVKSPFSPKTLLLSKDCNASVCFCSASFFSAFNAAPKAFFSAGGTFRKAVKNACIEPFLLR